MNVKFGIAGTKYSMPVYDADDDAKAAAAAEAEKGVAAALAAKAAADAAKAEADKKAADEAAAAAKLEAEKNKNSGMSDAEAKLLKETMKAKKDLDEAKARLKLFEGIDPEAIKKMLAEKAEDEKKAAEARGDFERVKKMMAEEAAAEVKKAKDEAAASQAATDKLNATINNLTVGTAFASSKFLADDTVLPPSKARAIYGSHFEIEDGEVVGYDKPRGESERTKLVNAAGKPLAFETAIKRIVEADEDGDSILRSKMKEGAGSKQQSAQGAKETGGNKNAPLKGIDLMTAVLTKRAADKAKK